MEGRRKPLPVALNERRNEDKHDDPMESFRRSLEDSWNAKSMGIVPTDAESAANATIDALESVPNKSTSGMFFVNILVPQYDISSGEKYYDEVLAVEFCIALAKRLSKPSMIAVRDSTVHNSVQRVLGAREKYSSAQTESTYMNAPLEDPFDNANGTNSSLHRSDDDIEQTESANVNDFRAKLMADWSSPKDTTIRKPLETAVEPGKPYRLVSLLGDARSFPTNSPAVVNEIVHAVSKNALPKKHEQFIIILAPSSKEEMIGIRALAQKYKGQKQFILVNSKLDPIPPELSDAETVYSILPLIGKPTKECNNDVQPPKVVVLRRFPRDWELYVDTGNGFDLAASCGLDQLIGVNCITGPTKQWIKSNLEMYLKKMR